MKTLETMTSDEKSLLLYLATRAVDHGGLVDTIHMNKEDIDIAEEWNKKGFVKFGRIRFRSVIKGQGRNSCISRWCELSEEAWKLAHAERRARCVRIMTRSPIDKIKGGK